MYEIANRVLDNLEVPERPFLAFLMDSHLTSTPRAPHAPPAPYPVNVSQQDLQKFYEHILGVKNVPIPADLLTQPSFRYDAANWLKTEEAKIGYSSSDYEAKLHRITGFPKDVIQGRLEQATQDVASASHVLDQLQRKSMLDNVEAGRVRSAEEVLAREKEQAEKARQKEMEEFFRRSMGSVPEKSVSFLTPRAFNLVKLHCARNPQHHPAQREFSLFPPVLIVFR